MEKLKKFVLWQKAMNVAENVYRLTQKFPRDEIYGLTSQMRRAAVSVASNIAEGQSRSSVLDRNRFLEIADGSKMELQTQLMIAVRIGYTKQDDIEDSLNVLSEIGKMIHALKSKQV